MISFSPRISAAPTMTAAVSRKKADGRTARKTILTFCLITASSARNCFLSIVTKNDAARNQNWLRAAEGKGESPL